MVQGAMIAHLPRGLRCVVMGCVATCVASAGFRADRLLLTWQDDPSTTMTVQWLEEGERLAPVEGGATAATPVRIPFVGDKVLDAVGDNWSGRGTALAFLAHSKNGRFPADEIDAELRLGWNHEGLLVRAQVTDPVASEHVDPTMMWAGDSVELFISDAVGSRYRYQVVLAPGRGTGGKARKAFFPKSGGPVADELAAEVVATETGNGYVIEALLPWSNLRDIDVAEGAGLTVQAYVNTEAGAGRAATRLAFHPALNSSEDPTKTVPFVLSGAGETSTVRARAVVGLDTADRPMVRVFGVSELAGKSIVLRSGEHVLGEGVFVAQGRDAKAQVTVPAPPAGRAWRIIEAVVDDEVLASVDLSDWSYGPAPKPAGVRYWPRDTDEADALSATTEVTKLVQWKGHYRQRVQLTGLKSGTEYRFRAEGQAKDLGFRTMPETLTRPLRFAQGGDTRHTKEWLAKTNQIAMRYDPDFVVWGGDFAYANGLEQNTHLWEEWFDANNTTLVGADGRVVPIIAAIGNHEVVGGYYTSGAHVGYQPTDEWRQRIAPYFYQFFAFPGQPGYGTLDFGDYLSLIILDTAHSNPIAGAQTEWLERELVKRKGRPHVFPVYHVPAYPSQRSYTGQPSVQVRDHWVPLFEKHGIEVAFEHHDHTYKRTHPIRGGKVSADGIVYFGDGAWGVAVREGGSKDEWYINRFAAERHAIIVTIDGTHRHFLVVNEDGEAIDEYPEAAVAK